MKTYYCDNPLCDSEAVERVYVSVEEYADEKRRLCACCFEVFCWGAQHGDFRGRANRSADSVTVD